MQKELLGAASRKHGYTAGVKGKRSEYTVWRNMIKRCHDTKDRSYSNYGGRGIFVCDRWRFGDGVKSGFECFIADMGDKPAARLTIERAKNSLGYQPDNCEWATYKRQNRNKTNSTIVRWNGTDMHLHDACELAGINPQLAYRRLRDGWSAERALSEPVNKKFFINKYKDHQ